MPQLRLRARSFRATSIPLTPGISISSTATWGSSSRIRARASGPFRASRIVIRSPRYRFRVPQSTRRSSGSSSATRTRYFMGGRLLSLCCCFSPLFYTFSGKITAKTLQNPKKTARPGAAAPSRRESRAASGRAAMKKMMKNKGMSAGHWAAPSGKMILFTKKKITMEMPPLSTVVPML